MPANKRFAGRFDGLRTGTPSYKFKLRFPGSKPRIARFLLAAHGKDKYSVDFSNVTVQSHIAVRTAPDHQLALVVIRRATNHGIVLQHIERLDDLPDAQHRIFNLILG